MAWDEEVRDICREHGIIYQGFSLLTANRDVLAEQEILAIAAREGVGPEQVIFRFALEIGMLPLTGTTNQQHMSEDLGAARITLSADEVQRIETIAL
jgi:diketogulonate reductase-like aldo/keto reductase